MPQFETKEEYETWKQKKKTQKIDILYVQPRKKSTIKTLFIFVFVIGIVVVVTISIWKHFEKQPVKDLSKTTFDSSQYNTENVDISHEVISVISEQTDDLDFPPDLIYEDVDESDVSSSNSYDSTASSYEEDNLEAIQAQNERELKETKRNRLDVILLTTSWCPACRQVRAFLEKNDVDFTEYDVEKDDQGHALFRKHNGRAVPVVLIDDQPHIGFSQATLKKLLYLD